MPHHVGRGVLGRRPGCAHPWWHLHARNEDGTVLQIHVADFLLPRSVKIRLPKRSVTAWSAVELRSGLRSVHVASHPTGTDGIFIDMIRVAGYAQTVCCRIPIAKRPSATTACVGSCRNLMLCDKKSPAKVAKRSEGR